MISIEVKDGIKPLYTVLIHDGRSKGSFSATLYGKDGFQTEVELQRHPGPNYNYYNPGRLELDKIAQLIDILREFHRKGVHIP